MRRALTMCTAALLGVLQGLVSCGQSADKQPVYFRLATYNTGLAPLDVAYAAERAPLVTATLAGQPFDLLCVQEVWQAADWDALTAATAETLPATVRRPAEPVASLCTPAELEPLQTCAESACPDLAGQALADCALSGCDTELSAVGSGCASCLIDGVNQGLGMDGLRGACLGGTDAPASYIYDGGFDTGILTNAPILAQESLPLDSYLVRSAVDYALVDSPLGPLHVFCAHLASDIPAFEYRGAFGSWEGEQLHQIDQLLAFVDEKTGGTGTAVILGDLNTGPAIPAAAIEPVWATHYQRLIDAGFSDPYAGQADVACTDCPDNSFHDPASSGALIDHILLRGFSGTASAQRVLTDEVTLTVDGQPVQSHLSDHYGLELALEGSGR